MPHLSSTPVALPDIVRPRPRICLPWLSAPLARALPLAIALAALAVAGGCAGPRFIAEQAGMSPTTVRLGQFDLITWHRGLGQPTGSLHVYLEGDGPAFRRGRQTRDPTPRRATGLRMAAKDRAPSVLYVARPCQYLDGERLKRCPSRYWSSHRYAPEVVTAVSLAIDWARAQWRRPPPVILVGYSGGGALAALIAARRRDVVTGLVTVAANLDLALWVRHHGVDPLTGSLDLARLPPEALGGLAQIHFAGARDRIVPPEIPRAFAASLRLSPETIVVVPDFNHTCCWSEIWPRPLRALGSRSNQGAVGLGRASRGKADFRSARAVDRGE